MSFDKHRSSVRAERRFGLVVGAAFAAFGGWLIFRENSGMIATSLLALGAFLMGFGAFYPKALIIPARLWMGLAEALSFISTRLVLGVVFFLIVTPVGFVKKLFGWDPLQRHSSSISYWIHYSERQQNSRHYEKMF